MIESITTMLASITAISGGNQFVAGVITTALLTTAIYLARNLPRWIGNILVRYCTTTLTLNNTDYQKKRFITNFLSFIHPKLSQQLSRTMSFEADYEDFQKNIIGIGYGYHLFFYKKRLFWIEKRKLDSGGSENQKEEYTISTIGRSHDPIKNLINDATPKRDNNTISIKSFNKDNWEYYGDTQKRPLDTVALDHKSKDVITENINHFFDNRKWYVANGLPHKITLLLHGKPGSGKTSLVKGIASHYDMPIHIINLSVMTDEKLASAMSSVIPNSIILMEDFDACNATKNRKVVQEGDDHFELLTLSGILNSLDGVVPLDQCIVVLTTNHKEQLDEAIYRKGRVDLTIEMNELTPSLIKEYTVKAFPDKDLSDVRFINDAMGCELHQALLLSRGHFNAYIQHLIDNGICERLGHFDKHTIEQMTE